MKLRDYYYDVVGINERGGGWAGTYYGVFSSIIQENNFTRTAEIGAGYGTHSKFVLDTCPSITHHTIIDPMKYYPNDGFATDIMDQEPEVPGENFHELYALVNEYLSPHKDRYTWLRKNSQDVTEADIPNEELDCIFVDGDHSFEVVLADLKLFWNKVRVGGQLLGDDYWMDDVRRAVDEFSKQIQIPYDLLEKSDTNYKIYRFKKQ